MHKLIIAALAALLALMLWGCGEVTHDPTETSGDATGETNATEGNEMPFVIKRDEDAMTMLGIYGSPFASELLDFWKACGINTLEFAISGYQFETDEEIISYSRAVSSGIDEMHEKGFKVDMLVLTNFTYDGANLYTTFHPTKDAELMERRLHVLGLTAKYMSNADSFTIAAGDPGGVTNDMGECGAEDYIYLVREFIRVIRENAPDSEINVCPWSVASFSTPRYSPYSLEFWNIETNMTKALIDAEGIIGESVGIMFPMHDYYRGIPLRYYQKTYGDDMTSWPLYPSADDIRELESRGTKNIWSWPYFLTDEVDNGDGAGKGMQLTTRYLEKLIRSMRKLGITGMMGNTFSPTMENHSINFYAMCRFATDSDATAAGVLTEYAYYNASDETYQTLAKVLMYIENQTHWEQTLPECAVLERFDTGITSPEQALQLLDSVTPRSSTEAARLMTLAESPRQFLTRVQQTLQHMIESVLEPITICDFENGGFNMPRSDKDPAQGNYCGRVNISSGSVTLAYENILNDTMDLSGYAEGGYINLSVWVEDPAGYDVIYIMLSSAESDYWNKNCALFSFQDQLQSGWNTVSIRLSSLGNWFADKPLDLSSVTAMRLVIVHSGSATNIRFDDIWIGNKAAN